MANYSLPQRDSSPDRAAKLAAAKASHVVAYDHGYPMTTVSPPGDNPGAKYFLDMFKAFYAVRSNIRQVVNKSGLKFQNAMTELSTSFLANTIKKKDITAVTTFYMDDLGPVVPSGRPATVDDYNKIFQRNGVPASAQYLHSDAWFANTYVGGTDPNVLKRLNQIIAKFPLTESHFASNPALKGDSLAGAIADGRVYYVDYEKLAGLQPGQHPQQTKYLYAPLAAFAVPRSGGPIVPFAIQLGQDPASSEIYTPQDEWSWKIAVTMTQASTNAHSAIITHLAYTHLVMDPVLVCTYRNLAETHPLYVLMHPHFINTVNVNEKIFKTLIGKDQFVDRTLGATMESYQALIVKCRQDFDFKANYLPNQFLVNQTGDVSKLPQYAFRDDALPIWRAIEAWTTAYVQNYYKSDADVRADTELQAWAIEINSPQFGQLKNFASGPAGVAGIAELVGTLTMIIFTAGPKHAMVNFAQRTDLAYVPTAPLAGYTPQISGKGHTEQQWLDVLPPLDIQLVQQMVGAVLGTVYNTNLGTYSVVFDPEVQPALTAFQNALKQIEIDITERNKGRIPLVNLLPSKIPQSINI